MLLYEYTAKNKAGEFQKGEIEAESEAAAAKILTGKDMFPISILPAGQGSFDMFGNKVSLRDKVVISRQLSTMINAGLPISQSLKTLEEQTSKKSVKKMLEQVYSNVEGGSRLADSLARFPKLFSPLDIAIIAAGESSGNLDKALARLADQLEKQQSLVRKIRSALIYPIILIVVAIVFLFAMSIYVVPQMESLYKDFGKDLPTPTKIMVGISSFMRSYGAFVIIFIIALSFVLRILAKRPAGRKVWDTIKIKTPIIKILLTKLYIARLTRTLAGLISSGVALLDALHITSEAIGNVNYQESLEEIREKVKSGVSLSDAIKKDEIFPPVVPQMIAVGEKTGEMDSMLNNLADYYEEEVDTAVKNITELIMPFAIIILGLLIGAALVSTMLPIYLFKA